MPRPLECHSELRRLRDAAGLSAQEVADKVAELLGENGRTGVSISQIERRGTKDIYVISALARIYGPPTDEIARLANPENIANNLLQNA